MEETSFDLDFNARFIHGLIDRVGLKFIGNFSRPYKKSVKCEGAKRILGLTLGGNRFGVG